MRGRNGSTSGGSEEARQFLQLRLARFGLYGSSIGWFFLAIRVVGVLFGNGFVEGEKWSLIFHLAAAVSLFALWFLCRSGIRSARFLRIADVGAMLLACTFYTLMGRALPAWGMPHYIMILALGFGLITRAIYVPSRARTTFILTTTAGIPLLLVTYYMYLYADLTPWLEVAPELQHQTNADVARSITGFTGAWWIALIAICSGASRVIYGLRKEVRNVRQLGQYTLVEKLGEGGMGVVYRATHAMLRRPTAIKLLPASKTGEQSLARFEKEVQLTARLTHTNTITVFDYGRTPDGVFYYAMELLDGATLAEIVAANGPLSPEHTLSVIDQVAGALGEAHAIGLIHRDIKPANIMLVTQGGEPDVAKVLDFGLVKELARGEDGLVTKADSVTGTPQYLAPEAITSPDSVDGRSDLYALGGVAYFLLTGEHVFGGETVVEICAAHLHQEPEPPSKRTDQDVSRELEALVLSCLGKKPDQRPQGTASLRRQLAECPESGGWTRAAAAHWWAELDDCLTESRQAVSDSRESTSLTVEIDVARRGQSAAS